MGPAIHITMDRGSAKTLDCFVEVLSFTDAMAMIRKHNNNRFDGRTARLGLRHVDVELSSQEELMKELFPRAKNVAWKGGYPEIYASTEPYNSGFKSFVSAEELVMLVKHAEVPQRVS